MSDTISLGIFLPFTNCHSWQWQQYALQMPVLGRHNTRPNDYQDNCKKAPLGTTKLCFSYFQNAECRKAECCSAFSDANLKHFQNVKKFYLLKRCIIHYSNFHYLHCYVINPDNFVKAFTFS